jgi:hypothetical protein
VKLRSYSPSEYRQFLFEPEIEASKNSTLVVLSRGGGCWGGLGVKTLDFSEKLFQIKEHWAVVQLYLVRES